MKLLFFLLSFPVSLLGAAGWLAGVIFESIAVGVEGGRYLVRRSWALTMKRSRS